MKKFYTNPLPAMFMNRDYGVKILREWSTVSGQILTAEVDWHEIAKFTGVTTAKYYIHEDSLPIFKPMIGDLIFDEISSRCNYEHYFILQENTKCGFGEPITDSFKEMGCFAILQRDGKQFFTPQEEV